MKNPQKDNAIELMSYGVPNSIVSRILNIPITTLTVWTKQLPDSVIKSKFDKKNTQISLMEKITNTSSKIVDLFNDYLIYDISDDEWEALNITLLKLLNELCLPNN